MAYDFQGGKHRAHAIADDDWRVTGERVAELVLRRRPRAPTVAARSMEAYASRDASHVNILMHGQCVAEWSQHGANPEQVA
jgi:hypothetical protein